MPKVLFIDCYDSFTNNLINLIESSIPATIVKVHQNTLTKSNLKLLLDEISAIVIGPGPGTPESRMDAGIIQDIWDLARSIPVLGVCFGMQALALRYGACIEQLEIPYHGQYGFVHRETESDLFKGIVNGNRVVRYHSLHVSRQHFPSSLEVLASCETDNTIMAIKHRDFPFYGVQYHPESVLSTFGPKLMKNFWDIVKEWGSDMSKSNGPLSGQLGITVPALMPRVDFVNSTGPHIEKLPGKFDPIEICESLHSEGQEFVLLHSSAPPGDWSIIGLIGEDTMRIRSQGLTTTIHTRDAVNEISGDSWKTIADVMAKRMVDISTELPFVQGLVGYINYEKSCEEVGRPVTDKSVCSFVFIENSFVIRSDGTTYAIGDCPIPKVQKPTVNRLPSFEVQTPSKEEYIRKVQDCKSYLSTGDSYELCLTGQTNVIFSTSIDSWDLFKSMIGKNPAPYSMFLNFDDCLVGTSPERFLSWSRTSNKCQFRPIKGTVKKTGDMSRTKATEILNTPKERGENLMIVDLIRHDLGSLTPAVSCPQLMQVEEYETVYQLVSVIEGEFLPDRKYTGIDALVHSLPPGSMTGAPKRRSVEILEKIESQPRGLYSGVAGFWSTHDAADWSVVIRSAFNDRANDYISWKLGAGGAITVLSDEVAEYDEMTTKLQSALQAFSTDANPPRR